MSDPTLAPRNAFNGVYVSWGASLVAAVAIAVVVPESWRMAWLIVAFGAVVLLSFGVQLAYGRVTGFIFRVAASVLGALLVMGVVSVGFGVAALTPS